MTRISCLLLAALASAAPAQNPYLPAPAPPGYSPLRGAAGGVLDVRPPLDPRPLAAYAPAYTPAYVGAVGGYGLTTNPYNPYLYNQPWVVGQTPMNGYLTGVASVTAATGQYWNDVEQARLVREQARRSGFETARQRVELERWYESQKPKTQDLIDATVRYDLERARRDPPMTEVWSGKSLNALLNNLLKQPSTATGPNLPLSEDVVRGLNLIDRSARGNVTMAKDAGRIAWPDALLEKAYDGPRERFGKGFTRAVEDVNAGRMPDVKVVHGLRDDLKEMTGQLEDQVETLSAGEYIAGRRLLLQLKDQVAGLGDPAVVSLSRSWRSSVKTVADLVDVCRRQGLSFGPSVAPGDERAYTAAYYSMRAYEHDVAQLARR